MVHKVADADDFKAGQTCSNSTDIPYSIDVLIAHAEECPQKRIRLLSELTNEKFTLLKFYIYLVA